jgi:hypothetical protein
MKQKLTSEIERRERFNKLSPFPVYSTEIINDLKQFKKMAISKEGYNNEPITYCKTCLSIQIKTIEFEKGSDGEDRSVDYCIPCGNTDLTTSHVSEWDEMYEEKYGDSFLNILDKNK